MRKQLAALVIAGTALAGVVVAPGAEAAPGDTSTTFTLTGGALSVSVPASANLTSSQTINTAVNATSLTGQLGSTTVADSRGQLIATWAASVDGTDFTTGTASASETVVDDNVSYWAGAATFTGVVTPVPGQLTALDAQNLGQSRTAMSGTLGVGNNTATWNPTLIVSVPAGNVAGTYTGTITHSVA